MPIMWDLGGNDVEFSWDNGLTVAEVRGAATRAGQRFRSNMDTLLNSPRVPLPVQADAPYAPVTGEEMNEWGLEQGGANELQQLAWARAENERRQLAATTAWSMSRQQATRMMMRGGGVAPVQVGPPRTPPQRRYVPASALRAMIASEVAPDRSNYTPPAGAGVNIRAVEGREAAQGQYDTAQGRMARDVRQGRNGLRPLPEDWDGTGPRPFIGFGSTDWTADSWVYARTTNPYGTSSWTRRTPLYRAGSEVNPRASLGWSTDQINRFRSAMVYTSQFVDIGTTKPVGIGNAWSEGDSEALRYVLGMANENGWDVDTALNWLTTNAEKAGLEYGGGSGGGGGGGGGGSGEALPPIERVTQTTFNLSDVNDARSLLAQQMRAKLGRDPTDGEVSEFLTALNAREKATPAISTTTYDYDRFGRQVGSSTTSTPANIDYERIADRRLDPREERRFQTSQVYETIMGMIG